MAVRSALISLLIASLLTVSLCASTLHVPDDYPTIQDAVDAATDGDIVLIAPGVYYENIFISRVDITLASNYVESQDETDIRATVIDGQGETVLDIRNVGPTTTIVGLTIQNGNDGISARSKIQLLHNRIIGNVDGIDYESGGGLCQWNLFENNYDDGIDLDGACEVTIEDCLILNNDDDGIEIRLHPHGGNTLNIIIRRNLIQGNGEDGIQFIDYDTNSHRVFRIERNIIANNEMAALGCMGDMNTVEDYEAFAIPERIFLISNTVVGNTYGITGGGNMIILNNIIADTAEVAMKGVGGDSIAAYNLYWRNGVDAVDTIWLEETCLFADPLLSLEHQPLPGSPCTDTGILFFEHNDEILLNYAAGDFTGEAPDLGASEQEPASD